MPIDEVKFGELIGTVGSLVTAVSDMKGAILPALKEQRLELTKYIDETRKEMREHKEKDTVVYKAVADCAEWMRGIDGEKGAKKELKEIVEGRTRFVAFIAGVTVAGGMMGHKLSEGISVIWKWLYG